jgi:hypothetical protein
MVFSSPWRLMARGISALPCSSGAPKNCLPKIRVQKLGAGDRVERALPWSLRVVVMFGVYVR